MGKVLLSHGNGGKIWKNLYEILAEIFTDGQFITDSAAIGTLKNATFTTDSYVVSPTNFPKNKNIGDLAVCGTINDLLTRGATPRFITCGLILEEGFDLFELKSILISMKTRADEAGVKIITGDTKVVERGKADKIYINTAGIGEILNSNVRNNIRKGDDIIVSGAIGNHGAAVMLSRHNLPIVADLSSDVAPLTELILPICTQNIPVSIMRDPTRGGLNGTLIELATQYSVDILIDEALVPINAAVRGVTEVLGLNPFYLANEGLMVVVASKEVSGEIMRILRSSSLGRDAVIIGEVTEENVDGKLYLKTPYATKLAKNLELNELPRIC